MWEVSDSLLVYTATGPLNMLLRIQAIVCPSHRPMTTWTDPCRDLSSSEILEINLNLVRWHLNTQRPAVLTLGDRKCLLKRDGTHCFICDLESQLNKIRIKIIRQKSIHRS